jgi:hypothetical protein
MKARDWFILTFTFIVGALCGMYLYVTSFKPIYEDDDLAGEIEAGELNIIGVQYGGYVVEGYIYPSFRVNADGSYDAVNSDDSGEKISGKLPKSLFENLSSTIAGTNLNNLSEPLATNRCDAYENGPVQYEYNIVFDNREYTLDTCLTNFDNSSTLGKTLLEVWDYIDSPDEYRISVKNSPDTNVGAADENSTEPRPRSTWSIGSYFENGFRNAGFQDN